MCRKTSRRENPPASRSKIVIIWVSFPVSTVWEQLMYPLRLQHTAPSWTPWAKWVEPGKSTPSRDTDMDRGIDFIDEMRSLTAVQSHTLFLYHNKCRRLLLHMLSRDTYTCWMWTQNLINMQHLHRGFPTACRSETSQFQFHSLLFP